MNIENHYYNLAKIGYESFERNILHRRDFVEIIQDYCNENSLNQNLFIRTDYRGSDQIDQKIIRRMKKLHPTKIVYRPRQQYWELFD